MSAFEKFLIVAAVIAVVWYWSRSTRRAMRQDPPERSPRSGSSETLKQCSVCGSYVLEESAKSCGRANCPYGR